MAGVEPRVSVMSSLSQQGHEVVLQVCLCALEAHEPQLEVELQLSVAFKQEFCLMALDAEIIEHDVLVGAKDRFVQLEVLRLLVGHEVAIIGHQVSFVADNDHRQLPENYKTYLWIGDDFGPEMLKFVLSAGIVDFEQELARKGGLFGVCVQQGRCFGGYLG
ncbi:hypothetical protein KL925_004636 [Ogataea polymorpha]|nr:hypothetical protein KL908_001035 [Ogataea polymorpha]KAG7898296.1 hypothetical protein KL935_004446 [Ogataea polymorpha]KAG7906374.1 hypothetical protein KL906_004466 [Ogataea polymorpha]KAG7914405.1 hypothetical protein KL927_004599 [Ogataea polymorpha]KAG7925159.1 hypothetical protein KL925_004636 [Ogataea polymorpha]